MLEDAHVGLPDDVAGLLVELLLGLVLRPGLGRRAHGAQVPLHVAVGAGAAGRLQPDAVVHPEAGGVGGLMPVVDWIVAALTETRNVWG